MNEKIASLAERLALIMLEDRYLDGADDRRVEDAAYRLLLSDDEWCLLLPSEVFEVLDSQNSGEHIFSRLKDPEWLKEAELIYRDAPIELIYELTQEILIAEIVSRYKEMKGSEKRERNDQEAEQSEERSCNAIAQNREHCIGGEQ